MHHLNILETVGRTPMLELKSLSPKPGVHLYAKLEGWNPTGSIKDRIVKHMIQHAERDGRIAPGDTVIEASTGNTGIALAMIGRAMGYQTRIVMPENVYPEIPRTLGVYGAEVHWVPAGDGVRYGPCGMLGGADGVPHDYRLISADHAPRPLRTKEVGIEIRPGDCLEIRSSGGGGWGPPARRSQHARQRDSEQGLTAGPAITGPGS